MIFKRLARILATATLLVTSAAAQTIEPGVWQHHQATLLYSGLTALYTCDGLEDKVRSLLLYLGARDDLKVHAFGCSSLDRPSRFASVSADFYSLVAADAGAAQTVPGQWVTLTLGPRRPDWMDDGECELVDQIKGLLTKSFSMRNLQYRTSCMPHQVTIADYNVRGQILKPVGKSSR